MVTKSIFREVRGFNESLGPGTSGRAAEDVDLFYRMLRAGATIAYEPKAIVYHERVSLRSWLRSRYPYGYGMGAFLAAHAQSDDTRAYVLFRQYIWMQVRSGLSSIRRASVREFAGSMLTISGVLCGFSRRWYQVCVAY